MAAGAPPGDSGFAPLRVREFRLLFAGHVVAQALMPLQFVTQIFWVQTFADESYRILLIGLIGTSRGAGALLFGLYGGALADRFDRRRLLMATQSTALGLNVAVATLMAISDGGPLALAVFFVLTFFASGMFGIDSPTRQAMVPDLLGPRLTPAGISLNSAGMQVAMPMSIFVSGFLIDSLGFSRTYALSGAGHAAEVAMLLLMRYQTRHAGLIAGRSYGFRQTVRDVRDGFAYTRGEPVIFWIILLMIATVGLGFPPTANLGPTWVTTVVGVSIRNFGFIAIAWGLGAFTASLLLTRYSLFERKGALLALATVGFGISFVIFATPRVPFAIIGNFGLGASLAVSQITSMSLVQHLVANEVRGRVMSLLQLNMGFAQLLTLPLAAIATGVSLEVLFPALAFTLLALVVVINLTHTQIWRAAISGHAPEPVPTAGR